jgi:hypothetical protein
MDFFMIITDEKLIRTISNKVSILSAQEILNELEMELIEMLLRMHRSIMIWRLKPELR